jgi:hypothetical protein
VRQSAGCQRVQGCCCCNASLLLVLTVDERAATSEAPRLHRHPHGQAKLRQRRLCGQLRGSDGSSSNSGACRDTRLLAHRPYQRSALLRSP